MTVTAVLVAGLGACHEGGAPGALSSAAPVCAQPVLPASKTVTAAGWGGTTIAQPGASGSITVTALGFSQKHSGLLSAGAEVGNSGTRIAYATSLIFSAIDSTRAEVLDKVVVTIPVIRPGERVPVGLPATSRSDLGAASYPIVRSVRVVLLRTQWLPSAGVGDFPRVTVRSAAQAGLGRAQLMTEVQITGTTNACTSEPATRVGLVYRDKAGTIVGGALATTADASLMVAISGCAVGGFHGGVYAYSPLPATADPSRTDAALYCDPARTVRPTAAPMQ